MTAKLTKFPVSSICSNPTSTCEKTSPRYRHHARHADEGKISLTSSHYTGSVLLLSKVYKRNEPLGLQHASARTSASSLPSPYALSRSSSLSRVSIRSFRQRREPEKKKTSDGKIVLEPQPDDSPNDPLNWPAWRRDAALLSLGF